MGRSTRGIKKGTDIPDEFVMAGISTMGSLLGMALSKGTQFEKTGSIWGGLAGSILGYYITKNK